MAQANTRSEQIGPNKFPLERLDVALVAVLALCVIFAAVVVGGVSRQAEQASSNAAYVAR
jgi:hypothetical protein